jgi:indole-3-glycerol phosphate synthase
MADPTPNPPTPPSLRETIERKRAEVERTKASTPMAEMEALVAQAEPPRNFFSAVARHPNAVHMSVIAEIQRQDPGTGLLRQDFAGDGFKPETIANALATGGAAALSIATDPVLHGGDLAWIERVKAAVRLPVLRRDLIIDPWQLWESRAAGADAVVLTAATLLEAELIDMQILAQQLQLTTLLEVHDIEDLLRVRPHVGFPHAGYSLLGIDNRGPDWGQADLSHTLRLADMVEDRSTLVSSGGIRSRDDLLKLRGLGVRIALIGEHLMKQADPGAAVADLLRTPFLPDARQGRAAG